MGSQVKLLLLAGNTGSDGSASALLEVDSMPAISHWLKAVKSTTRLAPIKERVFIITTSDHHSAFLSWAKNPAKSAGGFPVENIIDSGLSGLEGEGSVSNIVAFLQKTGATDTHLVVGEADWVFEPAFNLQRVVEHSLVRGKDVLTYVVLPPGEGVSPHTLVGFDDPSSVTPQVIAIEPSPSADTISDGATYTVLAPLIVLRRTTLPDVLAYAHDASSSGLPGSAEGKQLGHLLGSLLPSRPLHGLPLDMMMTTRYAESLAFANGFFRYYLQESQSDKGEAAKALSNASDLAMAHRSDPHLLALLAVSSPVKQLYLRFHARYRPDQQQQGNNLTSTSTLPERFADVTVRRHAPRTQHPVYETSNNIYGLKAPVQEEMPNTYHGTTQEFTRTFGTLGMPRDAALVTSLTRSKVHNALDEFSTCHR